MVNVELRTAQDCPIERFIDDVIAMSIIDVHVHTSLFGSFGGPSDSFVRAPDPDVPPGIEVLSKVDFSVWTYSWVTTLREQLCDSCLD
ncbi:MAG: hypothetical protein ACRDRT_14655 [Pseudonocardiaceae bacterium]